MGGEKRGEKGGGGINLHVYMREVKRKKTKQDTRIVVVFVRK